MERREMIALVAAPLHAVLMPDGAGISASDGHSPASALHWEALRALCASFRLDLLPVPKQDAMLGGAHARLQLYDWEHPAMGGAIWYDAGMKAPGRLFAIAHELGHFHLHRGEGVTLHPPCDAHAIDERANTLSLRADAIPNNRVEEYTPRARRELEANAFAAELLAPCGEVRRRFLASAICDTTAIAAHFGISEALAQRRLVESVLCADASAVSPDHTQVVASGVTANSRQDSALATQALLDRLDHSQRLAAMAQGPALVVAGPGAGKTATLVGRVAYLVGMQSAQPEHVLALTFSNRAAGEMRERLMAAGLPGERMPVLTIHAFAASLLREYAPRVPVAPGEPPLTADFRILDATDAFLLLEELLPDLDLHYYRSLARPTTHLPTLEADFAQARNQLWTPEHYLHQVEMMPLAPEQREDAGGKAKKKQKPKPPPGMFTREQIERARERASAYAVWDRALRQRNLLDYGGLILRAVELLRTDATVRAEVQTRYRHVLVDEFQDTNVAAWELLRLVAGAAGAGLWVVGDRNQAIYRWRGASPRNLRRLVEHYPTLTVATLNRNYRSTPNLVQLGVALATQMAEPDGQPVSGADATESEKTVLAALAPVVLTPERPALTTAHPDILRQENFTDAEHERMGIAEAIQRLHAQGYRYGDQAILLRRRKQVAQMARTLTEQGVPVAEVGDLFAQEAVKDTLTFLALAAGPDGRALLRANALLPAFGSAPLPVAELRLTLRLLAEKRLPLPWTLLKPETQRLLRSKGVSEASCQSLAVLAQAANDARTALGAIFTRRALDEAPPAHISEALVRFLLQPGGYAWRLAHTADGETGKGDLETRAARLALAALGELAGIALRFDSRWTSEPGFRERLMQATRRKRTNRATPEIVDTAAPSLPFADVLEDDSLADVANAPEATDAPLIIDSGMPDVVNPVACFLRYVDALRGSDGAPTVPAGDADAVQALTLHGSKGLEFPVVYLPALYKRQPSWQEATPPGFWEVDAAEGDPHAAEERCLFYVGLTRARDVVAFTRAITYGKAVVEAPADDDDEEQLAQVKAPKVDEPLPALRLLYGDPLFEHAAPLLDEATIQHLREQRNVSSASGDQRTMSEVVGDAVERQPEKPLYRLADLQQYLHCPRQYHYAQSYGLLDPSDSAPQRFHRFMRRALPQLDDLHTARPDVQWPDAARSLQPLWQEVGPAGDAHDEDYWQGATHLLQREWDTLCRAPVSAIAGVRQEAVEMVAELRACRVAVKVDRLITDDATNTDTLMRLYMRRPKSDDLDDLDLRLYAIAHQQMYPGRQARILVAYIGAPLASGDGDADEQSSMVDVTGKARSAAQRYLTPGRKGRSALDKLDEVARAIAAGKFAPAPKDDNACATCPYCYVCPADLPDNDE